MREDRSRCTALMPWNSGRLHRNRNPSQYLSSPISPLGPRRRYYSVGGKTAHLVWHPCFYGSLAFFHMIITSFEHCITLRDSLGKERMRRPAAEASRKAKEVNRNISLDEPRGQEIHPLLSHPLLWCSCVDIVLAKKYHTPLLSHPLSQSCDNRVLAVE